MSFDHNELGIDLEYARRLPECQGCRKKSDGSKRCPDGTILCGAHFDAWTARRKLGEHALTAAEFAKELREGKFRPCWEARIEE